MTKYDTLKICTSTFILFPIQICPSVASKTLISHKLASFPFTSKYKLTQNSSPSKQLIIPQHQMSILNFVKKDKISQHQGKMKLQLFNDLFFYSVLKLFSLR